MESNTFCYKPAVRGDIDAFFGLFIDNIANLVILATTLIGVMKMPTELVYGRVLPAFGLAVLAGSVYYYYQAKQLAAKEQRCDVTAQPFGAPTTALFGFLFSIMLPVYIISGDPMVAYRVGVAACLINGVIEVIGSFCGEFIRKITPRAALLGTLAGIAIAFIALKPTAQVFARPQIGFLPMAIIFLGFLGKKKMPGNLPAGVVAVALGAAIAWIGGYMDPSAIGASFSHFSFYAPKLNIGEMLKGFKDVVPYISVIIPLAIHNFLSTMQNVESATAMGDSYDTFKTMLVDGLSTILGALFGSVLPTTVYIGHPGYKKVGAHAAYSLWNGIAVAVVCMTGLITFIQAIIPVEAVYVILLYVGLVITGQAFQATEKRHAPAVAIALIPHIANFAIGQINNVIKAFNCVADAEGIAAMTASSVDYTGLTILSSGAAMSAMLLAALVAFLIDHDFKKATIVSAISAVMAFFGLIHAPQVAWAASPWSSFGYLTIGVVTTIFYFSGRNKDHSLDLENSTDCC